MRLIEYADKFIRMDKEIDDCKGKLGALKEMSDVNKIPLWVLKSYVSIHRAVRHNYFTQDNVKDILGKDNVAQHLKELRDYGMVEWKKDQKDLRITRYRLMEKLNK